MQTEFEYPDPQMAEAIGKLLRLAKANSWRLPQEAIESLILDYGFDDQE